MPFSKVIPLFSQQGFSCFSKILTTPVNMRSSHPLITMKARSKPAYSILHCVLLLLHTVLPLKKYRNGSCIYDRNSFIQLKQRVLTLSADDTLGRWGEGREVPECAAPQVQSTNEAMKTDKQQRGFLQTAGNKEHTNELWTDKKQVRAQSYIHRCYQRTESVLCHTE